MPLQNRLSGSLRRFKNWTRREFKAEYGVDPLPFQSHRYIKRWFDPTYGDGIRAFYRDTYDDIAPYRSACYMVAKVFDERVITGPVVMVQEHAGTLNLPDDETLCASYGEMLEPLIPLNDEQEKRLGVNRMGIIELRPIEIAVVLKEPEPPEPSEIDLLRASILDLERRVFKLEEERRMERQNKIR